MFEEEDLYKLLNVDQNASYEDIKKQYKILALKHHPDKNNGDDVHFKKLQEAYNILSNEEKRHEYDLSKKPNINMLFNDLFNSQNNEQQKIHIPLSFDEVLYGCYKTYSVKTIYPCTDCNETGIHDHKRNSIQCRECFGRGTNPTIQFLSCMTCNGKGIFIINDKKCNVCNGEKHIVRHQEKSIYLPPGVRNNEIINISTNIILIIEHKYHKKDIKIKNLDIHIDVNISMLDLLSGFTKKIHIGEEYFVIQSNHLFDCNEPLIVQNKGIKSGSLIFHFHLIIDTQDKLLNKISKSIHSLVKQEHIDLSGCEVITINDK